jgi:two-component system, sporulation sensor kinase D
MKYIDNRIILYFLLVILPTTIFTGYYSIQVYHKDANIRNNHAKWVASHHQEQWDNLISQSVTTLNMISITMGSIESSKDKLEYLLSNATETDPRYSGFFILDAHGKVIHGKKSLLKDQHLLNQLYIQEVIHTKDIIISDHPETLTNGHKVIGIAKPLLDSSNNITYIIVTYINSDYIKSIIQLMFPTEHVVYTNSKYEEILDIRPTQGYFTDHSFYTLPINRIPWKVHVEIPEPDHIQLFKHIALFSIIIIVIFHLVFFSIHSYIKQKRTAKELKQQQLQKLEVLGTFAASLAHEIRNPLTGIKGLVQLLYENTQAEKDKKYLTVIGQEINRINEIVSEFLTIGKPVASNFTTLDLKDILNDLLPLIEYEASRNHQFQWELPDDSIFIEGSKDQIKQVVLNIIKNAIESIEKKGRITLQLISSEEHCQLIITDTGKGISPKEVKKIFNPFYTSKETGTGLGLVVCKQIIDSMNGEIHISSEVNIGTSVTIILPLVHQNEKS